eukprot:1180850-Prorocentrum_minimum.AAC.3
MTPAQKQGENRILQRENKGLVIEGVMSVSSSSSMRRSVQARHTGIFSPLLRLAPATGIFALPFCVLLPSQGVTHPRRKKERPAHGTGCHAVLQ